MQAKETMRNDPKEYGIGHRKKGMFDICNRNCRWERSPMYEVVMLQEIIGLPSNSPLRRKSMGS